MLPNYIRMHRRKHALSQAEVARLVGGVTETAVLRHERFRRQPGLPTAMAYAVLFQVDPRELFAGMVEETERAMLERAEELLESLPPGRLGADLAAKRLFLEQLITSLAL